MSPPDDERSSRRAARTRAVPWPPDKPPSRANRRTLGPRRSPAREQPRQSDSPNRLDPTDTPDRSAPARADRRRPESPGRGSTAPSDTASAHRPEAAAVPPWAARTAGTGTSPDAPALRSDRHAEHTAPHPHDCSATAARRAAPHTRPPRRADDPANYVPPRVDPARHARRGNAARPLGQCRTASADGAS